MSIIRSTPEQIKEYFDSPRLSQSKLKLLLTKDPQKFIEGKPESELYYEEKGHFIIGSGVDCILTQGRDVYDRTYYVQEELKSGDTVLSIVKKAFDSLIISGEIESVINNDISSNDNLPHNNVWKRYIYDSCNFHEYYNNRKKDNYEEDERYKTIIKSGGINYWDSLIKSQGKIIVDAEQNNKILAISNSFLANPRTENYFKDSDSIDIYFQLPIYFEYRGIECKALLDSVIVNHNNKTITPVDGKTIALPTLWFHSNFKQFRYDFQAAFYNKALELDMTSRNESYVLKPFTFLVESTVKVGEPLVYKCNSEVLYTGQYGRPAIFDSTNLAIINREIMGFEACIDLYLYYQQNGWEVNKEIRESNGIFELGWLDKYIIKNEELLR